MYYIWSKKYIYQSLNYILLTRESKSHIWFGGSSEFDTLFYFLDPDKFLDKPFIIPLFLLSALSLFYSIVWFELIDCDLISALAPNEDDYIYKPEAD